MSLIGRLQDKVIVVTGGASGIGLASAELFVREGARVVVADIAPEGAQPLADRYPEAVRLTACDVTREDDVEAAIVLASARFGRLDGVFNNAGAGGSQSRVDEISVADWDHVMALLLRSVMLGIKHATPALTATGGAIVNTASLAGLQAGAAPLAYSVAKAGVIQLTRVAAAELARHGIRVNAVSPGLILTPIFARTMGLAEAQGEQFTAELDRIAPFAQPLHRTGRPEDVAEAALFLLSDASKFITGVNLPVEGGATVGPRHAWDPKINSGFEELIAMAAR